MKSNLTRIFEIQREQAKADRLEFCVGILAGLSLKENFTKEDAKNIGVEDSAISHQKIADCIDNLIVLSQNSFKQEDLEVLIDLSLEIETVRDLSGFQSSCDSIIFQRFLLPALGVEDELTTSLYEESMNDYQQEINKKVKGLQRKIDSYLPKNAK